MGRLLGAVILLVLSAVPAFAQVAAPQAVQQFGDGRLSVGGGVLAFYASQNWNVAQPAVTRAVVIVHGLNRNADDYFATAQTALQLSGVSAATTFVIAPQFLADADIAALHLPAELLRWGWNRWSDGRNAEAPAPVSSFAALDAVLGKLGDRTVFPALSTLVVAGFSAGGQLVQRYAAVGHAAGALEAAGVHVRYVVGSPSSYLYFSAERPGPIASCAGFNDWRYGLAAGVPAYVGASPDPAALEHAYAARDITYLLGGADTNPEHRELDRSCGGEAEGPTRLARGIAFTDALQRRNPAETQPRWIIPGVGHNARRIFTSACGVAALFGTSGCVQP